MSKCFRHVYQYVGSICLCTIWIGKHGDRLWLSIILSQEYHSGTGNGVASVAGVPPSRESARPPGLCVSRSGAGRGAARRARDFTPVGSVSGRPAPARAFTSPSAARSTAIESFFSDTASYKNTLLSCFRSDKSGVVVIRAAFV